jgi:hypothetical protein
MSPRYDSCAVNAQGRSPNDLISSYPRSGQEQKFNTSKIREASDLGMLVEVRYALKSSEIANMVYSQMNTFFLVPFS